jgi:metallophosphoesterase (TIGR00282 family)
MRILYLGDVVGKAGREAVINLLPQLKTRLKPDFTIVNGENAAGGFGINEKIIHEITRAGADCITCGDHTFDQKETKFFLNSYKNVLRPHNMPDQLPGKGFAVFDVPTKTGKKIAVIHNMGQVFMRFNVNCPFEATSKLLKTLRLGIDVDYIFYDFHAEATSEKLAMAHFVDGKVSAICGSHTHVPTGDVQILDGGTANLTDAGMCGDYNSIIGFQAATVLPTFINKVKEDKFKTADGEGTLCGMFIEVDDKTGLAINADYVRFGARLKENVPSF